MQVHDGRQWVTRAEVRTPLPPSDPVRSAQSKAHTWYQDQNYAVVEFPATTTDRLRIVARRSTLGFQPDETAVKATGWQAGGPNLHLRKIEIYAPEKGVDVTKPVAIPGGPTSVPWKPASNNPAGFADLLQLFQPNLHVCAYAVIYVRRSSPPRRLSSAK